MIQKQPAKTFEMISSGKNVVLRTHDYSKICVIKSFLSKHYAHPDHPKVLKLRI